MKLITASISASWLLLKPQSIHQHLFVWWPSVVLFGMQHLMARRRSLIVRNSLLTEIFRSPRKSSSCLFFASISSPKTLTILYTHSLSLTLEPWWLLGYGWHVSDQVSMTTIPILIFCTFIQLTFYFCITNPQFLQATTPRLIWSEASFICGLVHLSANKRWKLEL